MPVIPNFSAWGPSANTGANYTAGARTGASIAQAQAEIGLAHQKLQQQATLANMEFSAKQEQRQRDELMQQHRLEIEKQMKLTQLDLERQRIDTAKQRVDIEAQKAARAFQAQQQYRQRFAELGGTDEAARRAMMEIGPEAGASSFNAAIRPPSQQQADDPTIGTSTPAAGMPEGFSVFKRGRNSAQLVPPPKPRVDASIPPEAIANTDKMVLNSGQVVSRGASPAVEIAKQELRPLIEQDVKQADSVDYVKEKSAKHEKLSESDKSVLERDRKRKARIAELRAIVMSGGGNASTPGEAELPDSVAPKKSKWTKVEE